MVSEQPIANKITVNAAEQDGNIESVTVFRSNRAEVKRRVKLELISGQNRVEIEHLPSCIDKDSIRVDGTGDAVIFDVIYHSPAPRSNRSETQIAVTAAHKALEALQKEREIAQEQVEFLRSYGRTLNSTSTNIEDVQRFLDMFGPRQLAATRRIQELDAQINQAQEEYNKARQKTYADIKDERGAKITVTVLAESDGNAELMLTYVASNASWTPLYDVRASIAQSPEASSMVTLHYRASVTQTTGENWSNVALKLSTASPTIGSNVPTLSAWRVGFPAEFKEEEREESDDDMGFGLFDGGPSSPAPTPPPMALRKANVETAGVLSTTFGIPGASDIPSEKGSHNVVIAVLDLQAEPEWICVPRKQESVFLTCKVVNSSEFTLLPGEAHVFVENNFVSKTQIEHVSPNDSFKVSLGVDSALRVTYPPAKTFNRTSTSSGFSFLAKDKRSISSQSQRIVIHNSRTALVTDLRILDHVPVSTDARIKVDVLAPGVLGPTGVPTPSANETSADKLKEPAWMELKKGVKARWAPLRMGGEGVVEWSCEIAPAGELELELAWEVSAPFGQDWKVL